MVSCGSKLLSLDLSLPFTSVFKTRTDKTHLDYKVIVKVSKHF